MAIEEQISCREKAAAKAIGRMLDGLTLEDQFRGLLFLRLGQFRCGDGFVAQPVDLAKDFLRGRFPRRSLRPGERAEPSANEPRVSLAALTESTSCRSYFSRRTSRELSPSPRT